MKTSILKSKSFEFALRVVKAYKYLQVKQKEHVLSKQLLRSGTAVGALVRETEYAESRPDFVHKMAIARKEANESLYWIELLSAADYLTNTEADSLHQDALALLKMLTATIKTTKNLDTAHPIN